MARFGFRYDYAGPPGFRPRNRTQYRYGITNAREASVHGFAPPGSPRTQTSRREDPPLTAEMTLVLGGTDEPGVMPGSQDAKGGQRVNGQTVPDGGCFGEAMDSLKARNKWGGGDAPLARRIAAESFEHSRQDQRVTAAFTRWSQCMRDRGFTYADPLAAGDDPAWKTPTPSARERTAATATAECKRTHNVVGIWWTVEAAYQLREINRHRSELTIIRSVMDEHQSLARAALARRE
ncbi:hypothetical protein [Streptomyces triculaminicus]|uniref:hypothetical protein n=1 Tax=Streptomyces triculaminicus TaxID=2816232 RepID=UPI0037D1A689